jgi:3-hydroxyisobutyrate dehydrogenase-like beta-hydroxyacid dehydrogenase
MAKNLFTAGYPIMVYNRTAEKARALVDAGAQVAASAKDVSEWCDILIMMVTGPVAVDELLYGPNGILEAKAPARTIINMSTVSPTYSERLSENLLNRGIALIEAPVSGSKKAAEEGVLVILAGGPRQTIAELEPLFLKIGKKVVYCGDVPHGAHMKLAVNLLLGIVMEGLGEAINFGQKSGLSTETMLEAVQAGAMSCPLFSLKSDMFKTNTFPPQFPLRHMAKDIRFVLQNADESGAAIPVGHVIFQLYRQALGRGLGDEDFAAVKKVIEKMSH